MCVCVISYHVGRQSRHVWLRTELHMTLCGAPCVAANRVTYDIVCYSVSQVCVCACAYVYVCLCTCV